MNMLRLALITGALITAAGCASTLPNTRHSTSTGDGRNSDAAWAQLDANQDGMLSLEELESQHAVGLLRDMDYADANHDGSVSREEWNAWWPVMTQTPPSASMAALNSSAAPTNGIR